MIRYNDGKQLKKLFREALKASGLNMTEAARLSGLIPQTLNNRFSRKDISITEINRIAKACGLCIYIDIVPAADHNKPGDGIPGNQPTDTVGK